MLIRVDRVHAFPRRWASKSYRLFARVFAIMVPVGRVVWVEFLNEDGIIHVRLCMSTVCIKQYRFEHLQWGLLSSHIRRPNILHYTVPPVNLTFRIGHGQLLICKSKADIWHNIWGNSNVLPNANIPIKRLFATFGGGNSKACPIYHIHS